MLEFLRRIENGFVDVAQATLVTTLFGFLAWFGASSLFWGLGFTALGAGVDLLRWFYRFDWGRYAFVPNDWKGKNLLTRIEHALDDKDMARKMARTEWRLNLAIYSIWSAVVLSILLLNLFFSDELFCRKPVLQAISYPAFHLVEAVCALPDQLVSRGFFCRADFIRLFYAANFYLLSVSLVFFFAMVSHNSSVHCVVDAVEKDKLQDLSGLPGKSWAIAVLLVFIFCFIAFFFYFQTVDFKDGRGANWNIHRSNTNLLFLSFFLGVVFYLYRVIFSASIFVAIKRQVACRQREEISIH